MPNVRHRITVPSLMARKTYDKAQRAHKTDEPIVCLTAYHAHTARLLDPYVDILLVGDSLGMVMYGMDSTLGVTLDMMIAHGAAVMRGSERALVVVDMPFGSYEESPAVAFRNAARIMKETGCQAVKIEGGQRMADTIQYLHKRGIPVMAHIGLTPQNVNVMGGFKTQGHTQEQCRALLADARAVEKAGAFGVVLEGMVEPLAQDITTSLAIPAIGIGASAQCDGQVLVTEDMLGLSPEVPRFVKEFASLATQIAGAAEAYAKAVRSRQFPTAAHVYMPKPKAQKTQKQKQKEKN